MQSNIKMVENYNALLERISKASGLNISDLDRRVEAKRAKLSGLISKEGAAQIVASELGISFNNQRMKISELVHGMKKVKVVGKVINLFPVRTYNKNNRQGKIGSFILADDSSNIRTVLWDSNHIKLIEDGIIKEDSIIEIKGASVRNLELHLTGFSDIKISNQSIENVKTERIYPEKKISDFALGNNVATRAFVVQIFEPRFFEICPECNSKVIFEDGAYVCAKHGKVAPVKRFLLNIVLDDGSGSIRAVLFSEQAKKLFPETNFENNEEFIKKREDLLGKEMLFSGNVRQNKFFNNLEFFINDFREEDIEKLIEKLEKEKS